MKHSFFSTLLIFSVLAAFGKPDFSFSNRLAESNFRPADGPFFWNSPAPDRKAFIEKYKKLAIAEMQRSGVPASVTMAQAIVESNAGESELAKKANNHFGIKCGADWQGKSYFIQDDEKDGNGNSIQSCFRKYKNEETSWIDHSDFLRDPKKYNRYGFLFHLDPKDYRAWAYGLKSAGYATGSGYAESLINVIETNRLYELDNQAVTGTGDTAAGNKPGQPAPVAGRGIGRVNDVKMVLAKRDETPDDISRRIRVNTTKLVSYNDNAFQPTDKLKENQRVFIQKKRNRWRGKQKVHYVKDNQLMLDVSQQYGVKLAKILKKNRLEPGEEPAPGQTLKLRGLFKRAGKPKLRSDDEMAKVEANRSKPDSPTASQPTTGSRPGTQPATDPAKAQNPYADDLPFEIGENGAVDVNKSGSTQPTPPTANPDRARPAGETTRPPIATTDSDRPNEDRATPSGERPAGGLVTPPSRPSGTPSRPSAQPGSGSSANPAAPGNVPGATYHTVIKGDTLYNLSKKYGTTPAAIQKLNNLPDVNIKLGESIRVK